MAECAKQFRLGFVPAKVHRLFRVEGQGEAATWTPVGAAWPNRDGQGFNISCEAGPLQGRLVLRLITAKDTAKGGQS